MIVNRYLSWGRKWFRIQPLELPALPAGDAHDPSVVVADRDLLRAALARLPRNQRAVLVMRYYLRLEDLDIADALGCSPATVRTYASRALAAVRALEPDPRDGSDHAPIHR
jgi:DNA-directed RNA polymerase specialized sigma24 family protein